jgi:hypothetical protein
MRLVIPMFLLVLPGCTPPWTYPASAWLGAEVASVAVFGRGLEDLVVSAVSGRDCSIVRLDEGKSYCRPVEAPPAPPEFCTRSLGTADCWSNPAALNGQPKRGIADGPAVLTPAQEADRTRRWPNL